MTDEERELLRKVYDYIDQEWGRYMGANENRRLNDVERANWHELGEMRQGLKSLLEAR